MTERERDKRDAFRMKREIQIIEFRRIREICETRRNASAHWIERESLAIDPMTDRSKSSFTRVELAV